MMPPFDWADLLNPLYFVSFAVWLFFELAILAAIFVVIGMPLLGIVVGVCNLVSEMRRARR